MRRLDLARSPSIESKPLKRVGSVPFSSVAGGDLVRLDHPPFDVLVALVDGVPVAIEDSCNHAGASLCEGGRSEERPDCVVCPMHGYVFSMKTGALIAPRGLCGDQRRFVAKIEDDVVVIWDPFELTIE